MVPAHVRYRYVSWLPLRRLCMTHRHYQKQCWQHGRTMVVESGSTDSPGEAQMNVGALCNSVAQPQQRSSLRRPYIRRRGALRSPARLSDVLQPPAALPLWCTACSAATYVLGVHGGANPIDAHLCHCCLVFWLPAMEVDMSAPTDTFRMTRSKRARSPTSPDPNQRRLVSVLSVSSCSALRV